MAALAPPPRIAARTRLIRPDIFSDDVVGTLAPETFLIYLGLGTLADDAGYLVWQPRRFGAALRPYEEPSRRAQVTGA